MAGDMASVYIVNPDKEALSVCSILKLVKTGQLGWFDESFDDFLSPGGDRSNIFGITSSIVKKEMEEA